MLALSTTPRGFYLGLVVIVLGVGLLKPNVSAIVADLYPEGGARRDSGFTIFYIGINVGGFLGPLVTGEAQVLYGARAGFAAAAIFMAVGVLQFFFMRRVLGDAGKYSPSDVVGTAAARGQNWKRLWVAVMVGAAVLAAVGFDVIRVDAIGLARVITYVIVGMAVLYFSYYLMIANLSTEERRRGVVMLVLSWDRRSFGRVTNRRARH